VPRVRAMKNPARFLVITTSGVCAPGPLAEAIAALGEDSVMFSVDNIFDES
jgi:2,3-dihydroxybenzoate decarboxylase